MGENTEHSAHAQPALRWRPLIVPRSLMADIGPVAADPNDTDDFVDAGRRAPTVHDERSASGGAPPEDDDREPMLSAVARSERHRS